MAPLTEMAARPPVALSASCIEIRIFRLTTASFALSLWRLRRLWPERLAVVARDREGICGLFVPAKTTYGANKPCRPLLSRPRAEIVGRY